MKLEAIMKTIMASWMAITPLKCNEPNSDYTIVLDDLYKYEQGIWDVNENGRVDPETDFYFRGVDTNGDGYVDSMLLYFITRFSTYKEGEKNKIEMEMMLKPVGLMKDTNYDKIFDRVYDLIKEDPKENEGRSIEKTE